MKPHELVLRRVGIALLIYVGVRTAGLIADFVTGASHSVTIDVLSLILGILLVRGSLGAARWVAFLSAFELATTAAAVVIGVPAALLFAREQLAELPLAVATVWALVVIVLDVVFALWVLRELRDPVVEDALFATKRGSIRRAQWWGTGFGLGLTVLVLAIVIPVATMWPRWTAPAVAEAHRQLGDDWEVHVVKYQSGSRGWSAHVVARRGGELRELDVHGDP